MPAPITLVRDFVNTDDRELETDAIATVEALSSWLVAARLVTEDAPADESDLALSRGLRDGLRRALELNHDAGDEPVPALAEALRELPVTLTWDGTAPVLSTSAEGALGGLTRVALAAHEAVSSGDWGRLKICALDECAWAYYDHSKNRSRAYCEQGCGNKVKTRAYRARQRAAQS